MSKEAIQFNGASSLGDRTPEPRAAPAQKYSSLRRGKSSVPKTQSGVPFASNKTKFTTGKAKLSAKQIAEYKARARKAHLEEETCSDVEESPLRTDLSSSGSATATTTTTTTTITSPQSTHRETHSPLEGPSVLELISSLSAHITGLDALVHARLLSLEEKIAVMQRDIIATQSCLSSLESRDTFHHGGNGSHGETPDEAQVEQRGADKEPVDG